MQNFVYQFVSLPAVKKKPHYFGRGVFVSLAAATYEENFKHLHSRHILYVTLQLVSATCSSGAWKYFALSELYVYLCFFSPRGTWQNTADLGKYLTIFP